MNQEERERIIERILSRPYGICGAEVCQVCGEVGTFSGWAGAMASHWTDDKEFVCLDHNHADQEGRRLLLRETTRRFCEVCQEPVERYLAWRKGHCYVCDECVAAGRLPKGAKRRYLEMQSNEVLEGWVT